jgi:hypothetical protein
MPLEDQIFEGAAWVASSVRFSNTTGTPLASASDLADGEALADIYSLAISGVVGGAGTVTVGTDAPNNPYKGRVANGVLLDGVTVYRNIIPGVGLVFSATSANGNVAQVKVGVYFGTFDSFGVGAGVPSAATRHRVVNTGSGAVSGAQVSLKTQAVMYKKTGNALQLVRPFADGADEKTAGGGSERTMPYALSISNTSGAGSARIADLSVDGVAVPAGQLTDVSAGVDVSGVGLKAINPAYIYRFKAPHALEGLEFALDAACANGDIANILIFPSRHVQIAREVGGSPDAADWGTDPVILTQAGQAAGIIQPAGEAFYYSRILVPNGASAEKNPMPTNISLSAVETGSANWAA